MVPLHQIDQFSFQDQSLPQVLTTNIQPDMNGYWQHQFAQLSGRQSSFHWYLGVANGQIIYSGSTPLDSVATIRLMQRYLPQTRQEPYRENFMHLKDQVEEQSITPAQLLAQVLQLGIANQEQLKAATRLKVLNDLDTYASMGAGDATFLAEGAAFLEEVIWLGSDATSLLQESLQRRHLWQQVKQYVPSLNLIPQLRLETLQQAAIPPKEKERIQMLGQSGKTLNQIALSLAKDSLEVASMFARLVRAGLINLSEQQSNAAVSIMIIDDSPMILKQFQHWVTALGYRVVACQQAETALATIQQAKPATIFIDINMPSISGFELVKQIRQQPQITNIPLVILTGEQKLSNKWRAQWSGCEFLTKPLSAADLSEFQAQLQVLLQRLVETPRTTQPSLPL